MRRRGLVLLGLTALTLFAAAAAAGTVSLWRNQQLLLLHFKSGNLHVGWVRGRAWVQLAEPVAISEIGTSATRFNSRRAWGDDGITRDGGVHALGFQFFRGPLQEEGGVVWVRETLIVLPLWAI